MAIMRPRPDRRRRILAAPLVMTALAPACVVKSAEPTTPNTNTTTATGETGSGETTPTGGVIANPPRPTTEPTTTEQQPTTGTAPVRPTGAGEAAPIATAPTAGTATNEPRVIANPPRPTATKGSWKQEGGRWMFVEPNGDRTIYDAKSDSCTRYVHVECKPGATCNPPPPQKVPCPDGLPADARTK